MRSPSSSRRLRAALAAALFTVFLAAALFWQCDRTLHATERRTEKNAPAPGGPAPEAAPVFVLFVDSLRFETAMDPAIMPALAALRATGTSARMNTVYQGHTVPAMRAIFTGGSPSGVFNVFTDFSRTNLRLASLFSELHAAGRRSAAWSSGQFNQFGEVLDTRFVHPFAGADRGGDPMADRDRRRVAAALDLLAEGRHALIVAHIEFTDYAGHQFGIHRPEYAGYFRAADALIAEAARRVPPGAALAVLGDHGHDERGAHKAGLDIPTIAVFRGSAFRAGFDLGTIEITHSGYFLHAALRQPLNRAAYPHGVLSRALVPGTEPPPLRSAALPAEPPPLPRSVLLASVALAAAAWRLWRGADFATHALAWTALGVFFLPGTVGHVSAAVLAVSAGLLRPGRRETVCVLALGAALAGFGAWLVHAPGTTPFGPWLIRAVVVTVMLAAWRRPAPERPVWLAAAAASAVWLAEPWQHAAGWLAATMFAGLGVIWLVVAPARRVPWGVAAVAMVALIFAGFYRDDGAGHWAFAVPISLAHIAPIAIAGGAAKLWLFRSFAPATRVGLGVAFATALLLGAQQWFVDRSLLNWHERVAATGLVGLFGGAWLAARLAGARTWTPLLGLAALFALFYHGVRAQPYHYVWADIFFAALYLASSLAPDPRSRAWLGVGGVALSFALVQGWLPGGVEWQAIYDWIPAEFAETHAGWFVPWIMLRQTLAFWIVRRVIVAGGGSGASWPADQVARVIGAWILGLVVIRAGHFAAAPTIETVQIPAEHLAGLGMLMLVALIVRPRHVESAPTPLSK